MEFVVSKVVWWRNASLLRLDSIFPFCLKLFKNFRKAIFRNEFYFRRPQPENYECFISKKIKKNHNTFQYLKNIVKAFCWPEELFYKDRKVTWKIPESIFFPCRNVFWEFGSDFSKYYIFKAFKIIFPPFS